MTVYSTAKVITSRPNPIEKSASHCRQDGRNRRTPVRALRG